MRYRLLGGAVSRVEDDGTETPLKLNALETWLAVSFLLEGQVMAHQARRILRINDDYLRSLMTRLRKQGFGIVGQGGRYVFTTPVVVDALELIELVKKSRTDLAARTQLLGQGRLLWGGGLPATDPHPTPAEEVYRAVELAQRDCQKAGRRLLIVDDRIAEDLAQKLRADHECETATSFEEYLQFEPRLQDFDLVVVDRHLKPRYLDGQGLDVVKSINKLPHAVPVMMMTYKAAPDSSVAAEERRYGLAASIIKSADGDDAYIEPLASRVLEVLADDPVAQSCDNIYHGMVNAVRRSKKGLEDRFRGRELQDQLDAVDKAAAKVEAKTRVNDLSGARYEWAHFRDRWDPS